MLSAPRLVAPRLVAARPALARRGRPLVSRAPRRSPGRSAGAYGERRGASGGWANEFGDEYESIDADDGWFEPPRGSPRRGRPPRGDRGAPPRGGRFDDRANRGGGRRRDFDDRGRRGGPPAARGDDWVEESFPCSGKAPGRIIGKGGATIARIQDATGARVDVLRDERVCVVSGPPAAVAAAVAQAKLVASEGDGPPGPWSDRDGARSVRRGDEGGDFAERVVPCSGLGPGRVIGKGGATVKRLQEDFGVRVDVRAEDGQCFVSGAGAENVDACAAEVARIIEEGDGYVPVGYEEGGHFGDARSDAPRFAGFDPTRARSMGSSSSQTLETLAFRTELEIGRIIGRGGATVRAIEEDTGARVQVDKRTLECVVSGSEAAVASAARTIRRVAEEGFGGAVRRIPCGGSEGLIIGPGGARVRALAARTKARIDVEKVSEFHSECVIRGNPDAVAEAADAVERALAEEGGFSGGFDERGGRHGAYERSGGDRHAYDDRERPRRRGYNAYPRDAAEEYRRPRDDAYSYDASRDEAYSSYDDANRRRRRFPEDRGGRGGGARGGGGRPRGWSDRGGGDRGDRYADGWD